MKKKALRWGAEKNGAMKRKQVPTWHTLDGSLLRTVLKSCVCWAYKLPEEIRSSICRAARCLRCHIYIYIYVYTKIIELLSHDFHDTYNQHWFLAEQNPSSSDLVRWSARRSSNFVVRNAVSERSMNQSIDLFCLINFCWDLGMKTSLGSKCKRGWPQLSLFLRKVTLKRALHHALEKECGFYSCSLVLVLKNRVIADSFLSCKSKLNK